MRFLSDSLVIRLPWTKNDRVFADDTYRCIFENEKYRMSIEISLKFTCPIDNDPALA